MKSYFIFILMLSVLAISCRQQPEIQQTEPISDDSLRIITSEITYDVIIKNPNPGDDWTEECLRNLKRDELIDAIFAAVYDNKLEAYDIFEDSRLTPRKIKKMEEDGKIIREKIGKFQFVEEWQMNSDEMSMTKRVTEIRMGMEIPDHEGFIKGYEPVFKVKLNEQIK
jgi:hypothetical protein